MVNTLWFSVVYLLRIRCIRYYQIDYHKQLTGWVFGFVPGKAPRVRLNSQGGSRRLGDEEIYFNLTLNKLCRMVMNCLFKKECLKGKINDRVIKIIEIVKIMKSFKITTLMLSYLMRRIISKKQ